MSGGDQAHKISRMMPHYLPLGGKGRIWSEDDMMRPPSIALEQQRWIMGSPSILPVAGSIMNGEREGGVQTTPPFATQNQGEN